MTDASPGMGAGPNPRQRMVVVSGDITTMAVDAIVNAANARLLPGGGVCGAIHRAAGPGLARACAQIGQCDTGDAVTTPGFNLPARYVIHAVGPVWRGGGHGEPEALASCYRAIVREASAAGARTVAIPAIATGIYGFPLAEACEITVTTVRHELPTSDVQQVRLVAFDAATRDALGAALSPER